jgi:hypothetical protein
MLREGMAPHGFETAVYINRVVLLKCGDLDKPTEAAYNSVSSVNVNGILL